MIPRRWTLGDYLQHSCSDRSHAHLSRVELADSLSHGLVELVRAGRHKPYQKAVVRVVRTLSVRGLSCTAGASVKPGFHLVNRGFADSFAGVVHDMEKTRGMLHGLSLGGVVLAQIF